MSNDAPPPPAPHSPGVDFIAVQQSPQFQKLKKTHRSFVFPVAVLFFVWYLVYVLLGAYAHDFMATKVFGAVNLGLILGLLQFVTTFVITMAYVSFANRKLDPEATAIREDLEAQEAGR